MAIPPGNDAQFTAVQPGVFGNLVFVGAVFVEGGPDLVISVSIGEITLTIGTTALTPNLTWAAIAALFNADAEASALAFMEGIDVAEIPVSFSGPLSGGTDGTGLGQYFFATDAAPPPPAPPVVTLTFKGQKVYA